MDHGSRQIKDAGELFDRVDWAKVSAEMHKRGFALVKSIFPDNVCAELIRDYDLPIYRKTVTMERHRFGLGEYKYFDYPLPELVQTARETIYPKLAPIANLWMERLNIDTRYPETADVGN